MISSRQILGIQFFNGDVDEAVALVSQHVGLLVAPSGTCFARLREDETYRRALLAADLAIADSGLMVMLWCWSRRETLSIRRENSYIAPRYGSEVTDRNVVAQIEQHRPAHVIIAIGSGAQEKLGRYLRENLSYRPAIHCIGAALGFITGEQTAIPDWADRLYAGWLWRLVAQPHIFIPRLSRAVELPWLIWKYRQKLP